MLHRSSIPPKPVLSQRAFWDTDLRTLDFERYSDFVITRVFERGSEADKVALVPYYGEQRIIDTLTHAPSLMPIALESAKQLFHLSDQDFACYKSKPPARNFSRY